MAGNMNFEKRKKRPALTDVAREAGVSVLTVGRIERGEECRLETMRKIILAFGYSIEDKDKVFQRQE